jgi:hypothetical protein
MKIKMAPPGSGPKPQLLKENDSPDPPRDPPKGGGDKERKKQNGIQLWLTLWGKIIILVLVFGCFWAGFVVPGPF